MRCPYCLSAQTKCINSRPKGELRWRRYMCTQCHERFTTHEVVTGFVYAKLKPSKRPKYKLVSVEDDNHEKFTLY